MFLNKLTAILLNTTVLSRLVYNLTVISFVFIVGFKLDELQASLIFTAIAVIRMVAAFMSFGFGANILKPIKNIPIQKRNSVLLHIIIVKVIFVLLGAILINFFSFAKQLDFFAIFLTLIASVWAFVDIYVESISDKLYTRYFVLKAVFAILILILKVFLVEVNLELLFCFLTLEGIFPLVFLLSLHLNKEAIKEGVKIAHFKTVFNLIKHGGFIWLSSFLQIGGSRLLYLVINTLVPLKYSSFYYIFLRVNEGLLFIPNNICAKFFKKILDSENSVFLQKKLRYNMLKTCLLTGVLISPALYVVLFVYLKIKEISIDNFMFLFPVVGAVVVLSFLRIWISREIILNNNLIASPFSYALSFLCTITSIYLLADTGMWIICSLIIYYLMSSIIPFIIYKSRMQSTFALLKKLCHV